MVRVKLKDEVFYGACGLQVLHMMGWATFEGLPFPLTPKSTFEAMRCVAVAEVMYQRDVRKQEGFLEEATNSLNGELRGLFAHQALHLFLGRCDDVEDPSEERDECSLRNDAKDHP